MKFIPAILVLTLLSVASIQAQTIWVATTTSDPYAGVLDFQFQSDGTLFAKGAYGSSSSTFAVADANGTGSKLVWYPEKAAFRAGLIDATANATGGTTYTGTEWNDNTMGLCSAALGYNTVATGNYSFAVGNLNVASGSYSIALGDTNYASGSRAFAAGFSSTAPGATAFAFGNSSNAAGNYSLAIGNFASATGFTATAFGRNTLAQGSYGAAFGFYTTANAYVLTTGKYNSGLNSDGTTAASLTAWVATDPAFEVGNGASATSPASAFVVYKNGNAALQGTLRCSPGGGISMGTFTSTPTFPPSNL